MFDIQIENAEGNREYIWQNSWGITTRTIGVMVMIHGDNKGLVLPPKVAAIQAVIIPVGLTVKTSKEDQYAVMEAVSDVQKRLKAAGIRSKSDTRDNCTPGFKYNHWELKGVPLRLEIGPKDLSKKSTRVVRRDNSEVSFISLDSLEDEIATLLDQIQSDMFKKAKKERDEKLVRLETWDEFVSKLDEKCMILSPWCENIKCEDEVKKKSTRM